MFMKTCHFESVTDGPMDGPMDQRTDTLSYRDARTHLKTNADNPNLNIISERS